MTAGPLAALAARPPAAPALHTGTRWFTVADLRPAAAGDRAAGREAAVAVGGGHPADAVPALVRALHAGSTPVVVSPGADPSAVEALLSAVSAGDPGAGWLVLPTSGTTTSPRAVLRTVESWDAAVEPFTAATGQRDDDLVWAPGPAASTLTLWALWHALSTGVPAVASGGWRGVPREPVLDEVTVVHAVPAVLADVLAARAYGALPRLRLAVVAGAHVPPALRATAAEQGLHLVEYYGAAELSFVAVDADGAGLRPFPGCALRVRDGEVEVRSPYVSAGYLVPGTDGPFHLSADGWAGVGDRGRITADGVLEVAGRGDAGLSVGGHVVLPADVERVLGGVDGVLEVICVGVPDARLGRRPAAVVRVRPGLDGDELRGRLRAAARAHLPPPARPVTYLVVDDLPRTTAGKPDRRRLAALLVSGSSR